MKLLTAPELEKIIFLYRMGHSEKKIIAVINEAREADEEASSDVNYYIQCIFEEEKK